MMCISPINIRAPDNKNTMFMPVPCGKCFACRINKANDWYIRLKEESKENLFTLFITLTYESNDGNVNKRDLQLFIKKLRKLYKIRYYAISEYGPQTFRPHYHMLLFTNQDIKFSNIQDKWAHGYVSITRANDKRLRYVARYHHDKGANIDGLEKNFMICSTKPAIGSLYVKKFQSYHENTITRYHYTENGKKRPLPRYYKNKLYTKLERAMMVNSNIQASELEKIEEYKRKYGIDEYFKSIDQITKNRIENFNNLLKKNKKL